MRRTRLWGGTAVAVGGTIAFLAQPALAQAATGSEPAGGAVVLLVAVVMKLGPAGGVASGAVPVLKAVSVPPSA